VLGATIELWPLAWFSPLAIAVYRIVRDLQQRKQVLSQVKLNFASIVSFVLFFIAISATAL
jgi:hypothetical protein